MGWSEFLVDEALLLLKKQQQALETDFPHEGAGPWGNCISIAESNA